MANGHSIEFKRDAVRIALSSRLTRHQVVSDLSIGVFTLNNWIKVAQGSEDASLPYADLVWAVKRLRKENANVKQERELFKKATAFSASQKARDLRLLIRLRKPFPLNYCAASCGLSHEASEPGGLGL